MENSEQTSYALRISQGRRHARTGSGRRIRESAGLSVAEVGAAVGVTEVTISRWERGLRSPRGANAAAWADFLEELRLSLPADQSAA